MGLTPANSHMCLTPWSVFQDGCKKAVSTKSQKPLRPVVLEYGASANPENHRPFRQQRTWSCLQPGEALPRLRFRSFWGNHPASLVVKHHSHWPASIPSFSTISSLLTLFSKFFSSFLHSTCSLSVSHQYLVLEEVYPPIKAAIPSYPTLGAILSSLLVPNTGVSPSLPSCSNRIMHVRSSSEQTLELTTRRPKAGDLQLGLLPVRSPLLR